MGVGKGQAGDWLRHGRARVYLWLFAALNLAALIFLIVGSRGGVDAHGFLVGTDFISFWTAGHMLALDQPVYDAAAHAAAQRTWFASHTGHTAFFYPPTFLPFCRPLGPLAYFPALLGWLVVTACAYGAAVYRWVRGRGLKLPVWLALAAYPPVVITITHGQTAFLAAAFLGGGLWLVRTQPWLGGALIGLATIKPQLGLLIPVVLLASREWRALAAAAMSAAALALLATAWFGAETWGGWVEASRAASAALEQGAVPYGKMVSVFAGMRLLGGGVTLAWIVQLAVSAAVVVLTAWKAWQEKWHQGIAALALAGAPLVTPFVLDYDLTVLAFPLLWLASRARTTPTMLIIGAAFAVGAFARPLALTAGVPIAPPILALLFWAVWRERPAVRRRSTRDRARRHGSV
jgi:hypothetical protein